MKVIYASAIAIAAGTISAPAYADSTIYDGYGSFAAGYNSLDGGSGTYTYCYDGNCDSGTEEIPEKYDGLNLNVRTSVSVPLGGAWGAQVDGDFSRTVYDANQDYGKGQSFTLKSNESTFAGHAFARNDKRLLGLFVQRTSITNNFGVGRAVYYAGGEAQAYLGKVTMYGQASYGSHDFKPHDSSIVNLGLQLRYFPQDNLKLTLGGNYQSEKLTRDQDWFSADYYSDSSWKENQEHLGFSFSAEKKLKKSRASIFADFSYGDLRTKSDDTYRNEIGSGSESYRSDASQVRLMIGVKLNFGSATLLQRDRSGASLDPARNGYFTYQGYYAP